MSEHTVRAALSAMCLNPFTHKTSVRVLYRRKTLSQLAINLRTIKGHSNFVDVVTGMSGLVCSRTHRKLSEQQPSCRKHFHVLLRALSSGPTGFWSFFEGSDSVPDFRSILGNDWENFRQDCLVFGGHQMLQMFDSQDSLTTICRQLLVALPPGQKPAEVQFFYDDLYRTKLIFASRHVVVPTNKISQRCGRWGKLQHMDYDKMSISFTLNRERRKEAVDS